MSVKVRERPKGSGTWWVFIDHQGKRKSKKIGRDKRLAIDVAKKIEAKLILGELNIEKPESNCPAFREYAEMWLLCRMTGKSQLRSCTGLILLDMFFLPLARIRLMR